jgi:hypothetical protein
MTQAEGNSRKRAQRTQKKEVTIGGEPLWCAAHDLAIFDLTARAAGKFVKEAAPGNDPTLGSSVTCWYSLSLF